MSSTFASCARWIRSNLSRLIFAVLVILVFVVMIVMATPTRVAYAGNAGGGDVVVRPTATK